MRRAVRDMYNGEYLTLSEQAKRRGTVQSLHPLISRIGEMAVDAKGGCNIHIRDKDAFNFDMLVEFMREKSRSDNVKSLLSLFTGGEHTLEAWERKYEVEGRFAIQASKNTVISAELLHYSKDGKTDDAMVFWLGSRYMPIEKRVSTVHRFSNSGEIYYLLMLENGSFASQFMDLMFCQKYSPIMNEGLICCGQPILQAQSA